MIFSSWLFAGFFAAVFAVYWSLPTRRGRTILLLAASYAFYMSWNAWLVLLIIGTTLLDYFIALGLERSTSTTRRKALLICSVVGNLGVLALFKYADFFILSLRGLLESLGVRANLSTLDLLLPVGISFYTFQTLSYTIDVYRGRIRATRSLIDFAVFVAFFPQLVAGPIVRASEFLPQLATCRRWSSDRLASGAVLFLVGLTKKLLIADQLAMLADPVFAEPHRFVTRDLWLAMFCYGGQIFCDFSGYSDMAVATARVLGFDLPDNFRSPYLATSLIDFWRRWHISLSTWLRDYLYIPLGGSFGGAWRTARNLMMTMLLGGLWHGASWTFVVWGAIHGAVLILCKAMVMPNGSRGRIPDADCERAPRFATWCLRLFGWASTLLLVHMAWVFFRCQPMVDAATGVTEPTSVALVRATYFVKHLIIPARVADPIWIMNKLPALCLLALMGAMQVYEEWVRRGRPGLLLPAPIAGMGYAVWILVLVILGADNTSPFIYFQF